MLLAAMPSKVQVGGISETWAWTQQCAGGHREEQEVSEILGGTLVQSREH